MLNLRFALAYFSIILLCYACTAHQTVMNKEISDPLQELTLLMTGSFDSGEQALSDSAFYPISLHMYPIWTDREGSRWLYVEQAVSSMPNKPYRQRVYELKTMEDGRIASDVYVLPYDSVFIGKYDDPSFFEDYGPEDLQWREGCTVFLKRISPTHYAGSTLGDECISTLRGAHHAHSKVEIHTGMISSWDQGFNAAGEQVWGAEKGPYIFKKSK